MILHTCPGLAEEKRSSQWGERVQAMRQLHESMKRYGDFDDYAAYQVWQDFNRQENRANLEANQQEVLVMRKGSREA